MNELQSTVQPRGISACDESEIFLFSVCTLVTDKIQYQTVLDSFYNHGFNNENSEFLQIDNTFGNRFDAYAGIREFVHQSKARYVIICHQDVELVDDGFDSLRQRLEELDASTPNWGVAGNIGIAGLWSWAARISDPHMTNARLGPLPARVDSLDENFLIIRRATMLVPSRDLTGFHFYGLDLCLQARLAGLSAHVIDFHLHHKSPGSKSKSFQDARKNLERKYSALLKRQILHTTCDLVIIGTPALPELLRALPTRIIRRISIARFHSQLRHES